MTSETTSSRQSIGSPCGYRVRSPKSRPVRAGPKVGAFFDLDGTLVAGFTGVIMTQDRLRRRQMSVGEFIGMVQAGLNHQLGRSEFEDLIGKGARMLRGNSLADIDELPSVSSCRRSSAGSIPRCASSCALTWRVAIPSCSARLR